MVEIWKPIVGYEGLYEVSNYGQVKSLTKKGFNKKPALLRQRDNGYGYMICQLLKNNKRRTMATHRIVAMAFVPNPDNKPQVNHKDGDKYNNVPSNLEWCTNSENQVHKFRVLKCESHGGHPKRKVICCENGMEYESSYHAARATGISKGCIFNTARGTYGYKTAGGYHWKFVE